MTFLEAQTELAELLLDTSTEFSVAGTKNKKCINRAYEYMYDTLKHSEKVKRRMKISKTEVSFSNKVGALPANFDTVDIVSIFDFKTESELDGLSDDRYYDFEVRGERGAKSMYIQSEETKLYISYIPLRTDLAADSEKFLLPEELHTCLIDFAIFQYNRMIRDMGEAANALQLANAILNDKLATL